MNDFIEEIDKEYPGILSDPLCASWVGEGWQPIVWGLCGMIAAANKEYQDNENVPQIKIDQIKEKFGQLRFYTTLLHDKFDYISRAIISAEIMSIYVCEGTGKAKKGIVK